MEKKKQSKFRMILATLSLDIISFIKLALFS